MLALRYLRPKRTFVSIITLISIIGVALGVAVLIVVISVMTGFDHDLREKNSRIQSPSDHQPDRPGHAIRHDHGQLSRFGSARGLESGRYFGFPLRCRPSPAQDRGRHQPGRHCKTPRY